MASRKKAPFHELIEEKIYEGLEKGVDGAVSLVAMVGPEEAEILLGYSKGNRHESNDTIEMYARDMRAGRWVSENGNPILITEDGRLSNGHHRLKAVVQSGAKVRLLISFGNPENAIEVQDCHRPRTLADRFALSNKVTSARIIAATRVCMSLTEDRRLAMKRSMVEVENGMKANQEAIDAFADMIHTRKFPATFWGSLMFARPTDPMVIDDLAAQVMRGEGIAGTAMLIRDYMLKTGIRTRSHEGMDGTILRTLYAARAQIEGRDLVKFAGKDATKIREWFLVRRPKNRVAA